MSVGEFVLALITVFAGAFLAFFVDNLRERRRLADWVRRYLSDVRDGLTQAAQGMPHVLTSLREAADALADLVGGTEPCWEALASTTATAPPNLMGALRGEAITAVPPPVVSALQRVEASAQELDLRATRLETLHARLVLPIYLNRPSLLSDSDRRGLELFIQAHAEFCEVAEAAARSIDGAVEALTNGGY